MVGDGYTMVRHCEFVEVEFCVEPDAGPIYCTPDPDLPPRPDADQPGNHDKPVSLL